MQFPTHRVTLKFTGIDDAVVIDTVLPTENNPYIVLYTPNDDSPTTTYLKTDFIDAVFKRNPPKIYSHEMFNGPSNLLQYTAKGKGPWLEKATAGYLVMTKNKGVQESSAQPINFLPITILDWNYDPVKNLKNDGRYVPLSFTYSDLYGTREESFNLRVVMGIPKSEEVRAWIEVFYFVLLETKKGTLQLVAFGFGQRAHFRDDFWANYAKEKDIPLKEPGNTGEAKEFDKPPTALNESSGAYIVEFDFAIKDTSGDPRGRLQGPLSREKPLVFLPTYHPTDDQPKRMKTRAVRTFLHEGKLQALIFGNAIEKKHRDMFSSVDEEDINPNQRRFFHDNSGPILQSCTISREPEKKAVNMLPLLGVNKFGEYVDASTVTNWKENMMTLPFDIPYKDTKDRDKTIKAVLIPLWSMKDETFRCFYVCIPDDGKTLLFVALVVFLWPPIDTITSFFTDNFYEKMKTFATKQQAAAKKHKKQVIEAPSPAPASPSMVPLKKRPPPVDPYTLTDPDTGVLTFLAPSPAGLKEGDLDMPGAAVTRQTSTKMQAVHSANFLSKHVQQTFTGQHYKSAMLENWKQLQEVQQKRIPPAHIEGWINGFEAWLDNWWFDVTHNSNSRDPTFADLDKYTRYDSNMPPVKINWAAIFGLQGQAAAAHSSSSPAVGVLPPGSGASQDGGGPDVPSASEETRKIRETLQISEKERDLKRARDNFDGEEKDYEAQRQRTLDEIRQKKDQEAQAKEKKRKAQEEENEAQRLQQQLQSRLSELQIEHEARKDVLRQKIDAAESAVTEVKKRAAAQRQLAKTSAPVQSDDDTAETRRARPTSSDKDPRESDRYNTKLQIQQKLQKLREETRNYINQRGATPYKLLRAVNQLRASDVTDSYLKSRIAGLAALREKDEEKEGFAKYLVENTETILDSLNSAVKKQIVSTTGLSATLSWDQFLTSAQEKDDEVVSDLLQSQISFLGCAMCAKPKAKTKAGCCGQLRYCGQQCADNHYPRHQSACGNKNGKLFV